MGYDACARRWALSSWLGPHQLECATGTAPTSCITSIRAYNCDNSYGEMTCAALTSCITPIRAYNWHLSGFSRHMCCCAYNFTQGASCGVAWGHGHASSSNVSKVNPKSIWKNQVHPSYLYRSMSYGTCSHIWVFHAKIQNEIWV